MQMNRTNKAMHIFNEDNSPAIFEDPLNFGVGLDVDLFGVFEVLGEVESTVVNVSLIGFNT